MRTGPAVLFEACEAAGVRRVIHFSAVGVDRGARSSFSASKAAGDAALQARDLDWVILRPSVVLGRPVYGASALFRGLATLPLLPRAQDAGPLQVVQLEDVVETVVRLLAEPKLSARDTGACRTGAAELRRGRRALPPLVRLAARPARFDAGAAVPAALSAGRPGRLARLAPASAQQRPPRDRTRRRRRSRALAAGDRHRAAAARRRAGGEPAVGAGSLVCAALPAEAGGLRHLLALLDRHRADFARAGLGTRRRAHAGRRCRRLVRTGRRSPVPLPTSRSASPWPSARTARPALFAALAVSLFYALAGTVVPPGALERPAWRAAEGRPDRRPEPRRRSRSSRTADALFRAQVPARHWSERAARYRRRHRFLHAARASHRRRRGSSRASPASW